MSDEVPAELRMRIDALAATVRPAAGVLPAVRRGVRRRRTLRRAGTVGGSAALVAGVALAASLIPEAGGPDPSPPVASSPAPTAGPTAESFDCPRDLDLLQDVPPIPDLAEQREIARSVKRATRSMSIFSVVVAEPTHLGVVALVQGHLGAARSALTDMGVAEVYPWDPSGPAVGLDEDGQVTQVLQWELDPVLRDVRRATRGIPGGGGFAYWQEAGAIVVRWKEPVPAEVDALAGARPNGAEVVVLPTAYSEADIRRAQNDLQHWLRASGNRDRWSSAGGCADNSGLVVGMVPPVEDRLELEKAIAAAVGMPVRVVPEERPVPLAG